MLGSRDVLAAIHRGRGRAPGPRAGQDDALRTTGYLLAYDSGTYTATVSVHGSAPIPGVPAVAVDYTGITTVHVLLRGGRPVQVLGPASDLAWGSGGEIPSPPDGDTSATRWVTDRIVAPEWSGTYRTDTGEWDAWGTTTRGGRSDVWQSNPPSAGPNLIPNPDPVPAGEWEMGGWADLTDTGWSQSVSVGADPYLINTFWVDGVTDSSYRGDGTGGGDVDLRVWPVLGGTDGVAVTPIAYEVSAYVALSQPGAEEWSIPGVRVGVTWYDSGGSEISTALGDVIASWAGTTFWANSGGTVAMYGSRPVEEFTGPAGAAFARPFVEVVRQDSGAAYGWSVTYVAGFHMGTP